VIPTISKELSLSLEAAQELAIKDTGISLNTKEEDLLLLDNGPLGYKTIDIWIAVILELLSNRSPWQRISARATGGACNEPSFPIA
jgi:hypothetical protein